MTKLTEKQQRFIAEYLKNPNGKRAAIAAGYSPATAEQQGSKLLRLAKVKTELERLRAASAPGAEVTPERVLAELAKLGFSDIRQVVRWRQAQTADEPNQVFLIDSEQINDDAAAAIAEIIQGKDGSLKVKLHDKLAALVKIGQHLGMFRPASTSADEPGKKEQAEMNAQNAEQGTEWAGLLN